MIYHVFANKSNIGDWLSAIGIQKILSPHPVVALLCDEPFVTDTLQQLSKSSADDMIVIGGGGLFMDYFQPFWRGLRNLRLTAPIWIWGVGYCDLKRERTRPPLELLRDVISSCAGCFVRDELTHRLLAYLHLATPVGCPSFAAIDSPGIAGRGLLHVDNYTTAGADVFECMEEVGQQFAKLRNRSYRRTNNRIQRGRQELDEVLEKYREADVVLSSALHGCIIAVAMGRKVVAVSGDWKIESFMQSVGLDAWVCSQEETDRLPTLLNEVDAQPDVRGAVQQIIERNRAVGVQVLRHAERIHSNAMSMHRDDE